VSFSWQCLHNQKILYRPSLTAVLWSQLKKKTQAMCVANGVQILTSLVKLVRVSLPRTADPYLFHTTFNFITHLTQGRMQYCSVSRIFQTKCHYRIYIPKLQMNPSIPTRLHNMHKLTDWQQGQWLCTHYYIAIMCVVKQHTTQ
jgi:hypothetical protein